MNSTIYEGQVSHSRKSPVRHRFSYRIFLMYLDLDELDDVFRGRWLWSARRPALARFRRRDHLGKPSVDLKTSVHDHVQAATGHRPQGPVRLLTNLSYFGYCFNPVSFYYCFDEEDQVLEAIVAEVSNTPWGERCTYVLDCQGRGRDGSQLQFCPEKKMHVSPFLPMESGYQWVFSQPASSLSVFMAVNVANRRVFNASLQLERTRITGWSLARMLATYPFATARTIARIYWQALILWFKQSPVYLHPNSGRNYGEASR